jgi:O-methyltransferase involved in polyketide biosynthesis
MEAADKIKFTEEKETLFLTLYAKALDYRSKNSILHDTTADELLKRIDYDFSKFKDSSNNIIVIRARHFDDWVKEFIDKNGDIVVLYLGCGLDTRIKRINPPLSVNWFDVDYPEVISLRRTFFSDSERYHMIESSITDDRWLTKIPCDKKTLVIAEGVLEYLEVAEVKRLLNQLTNYFVEGQIIFDVMNKFAVNAGKKKLKDTTGAAHKWAIHNVEEVDKLNPELKRISNLSLFRSRYMHKFPFRTRLLLGILSIIPSFKNMMLLLRYKF